MWCRWCSWLTPCRTVNRPPSNFKLDNKPENNLDAYSSRQHKNGESPPLRCGSSGWIKNEIGPLLVTGCWGSLVLASIQKELILLIHSSYAAHRPPSEPQGCSPVPQFFYSETNLFSVIKKIVPAAGSEPVNSRPQLFNEIIWLEFCWAVSSCGHLEMPPFSLTWKVQPP